MSSYRAVIVDFGGVLTTPLIEAMDRFAAETGVELQDLARAALGAYAGQDDDLVTGFETGRVSEEEFSRAFVDRLEAATGRRVEAKDLVKRLFDVRVDDQMLDGMRKVAAAGFKTAVLSNSWGHSLYPRELLDGLFDEVILSGEVGLRKPDPEMFRLALRRLDVEGSESVFVDDHPGHLEPAARLGMATVMHTVPARTLAELQTLLGVPLL